MKEHKEEEPKGKEHRLILFFQCIMLYQCIFISIIYRFLETPSLTRAVTVSTVAAAKELNTSWLDCVQASIQGRRRNMEDETFVCLNLNTGNEEEEEEI